MMLFKLSDKKNLHFTNHNLNLQRCIRTQNREINLSTFKGKVLTHLAITIQDFAFSKVASVLQMCPKSTLYSQIETRPLWNMR